MPTYVYRCPACAYEFEQFQKMSDEPLKFCPQCGEPIHRVIYPVGVVFKGSGWYITDNRKPSSNGHDHESKPKDKKDGSDSSSKSDTTSSKSDKSDKTATKAEKAAS